MTAPAPAPAALASPYAPWYCQFLRKRHDACSLPWHDPYRLAAAEHRAVARSLQQFQLGEWAHGRGLLRRASLHPVLGAEPWFLPALRLFIAEEQEHSRMLGNFLDREHIPLLPSHWLDGAFRRLRKLAGLEICCTVLVTAEVLAMPFYRALHDSTRSPLLRSICKRILSDEAAHLQYQALTLGLARRRSGAPARRIRCWGHWMLFDCTSLLLWQQHRRMFHAAGWGFRRFWQDSRREFSALQLRIQQVCAGASSNRTWP